MEISEISFKNTLFILNNERKKALTLDKTNMVKMSKILDKIIGNVEKVMNETEDVVLIGSEVEVMVNSEDYEDVATFRISDMLSVDGSIISFYSPLGRNLLGHKVGETISFKVEDTKNIATIRSINNVKESEKTLKKQ